jgi:hypothetical protein
VISKRAGAFDSSGIRKVFDLAAKLQDPINLSIGQPDFEMPPAAREAAKTAIDAGRNGYTPTQGIAALRERGLLVPMAGHNVIRLLPPLTASAADLAESVAHLRAAFSAA